LKSSGKSLRCFGESWPLKSPDITSSYLIISTIVSNSPQLDGKRQPRPGIWIRRSLCLLWFAFRLSWPYWPIATVLWSIHQRYKLVYRERVHVQGFPLQLYQRNEIVYWHQVWLLRCLLKHEHCWLFARMMVKFARDIARGMKWLHSAHIIHRLDYIVVVSINIFHLFTGLSP
jgi:hypothetical protein